jgi:MoaA/NifB/PqqE/SkfB family radical SAM enzyme
MANTQALIEHAWELARDWRHSGRYPARPESISFEITAACDAKCVHCPREDMDRPMKQMPMPLFRRLVDQAAALRVPYLCPNGYGEICTIPLPALEEYLGYITRQKHRFKVVLNTNANRMTEERAALFLKHRVHVVNVTIDGATAETAESIRRKLKFDQVEGNVKRLLAMRKKAGVKRPMVRVAMIAMAQTIPEIPAFFERWKGVADAIAIGGFTTRLESVNEAGRAAGDGPTPRPWKQPDACVLPFRDLNIWSDGIAVACCEDWNESRPVGDLKTQSIDEIWHGPELTEIRRKHKTHKGHEVDICAKCQNWHRPSRAVRLWT